MGRESTTNLWLDVLKAANKPVFKNKEIQKKLRPHDVDAVRRILKIMVYTGWLKETHKSGEITYTRL